MRELLAGDGEFTLLTRREPEATLQALAASLVAIDTAAELVQQVPRRCAAVQIDMTMPRFGLSEEQFSDLADSVDAIWHVAASTELAARLDDLRTVNVVGTGRVLEFAAAGRRNPDLFYIGTAFVAGRRALHGTAYEEELDGSAGFETRYERSKFEAECLVRRFADSDRRRVVVMRPSILVTDRAPHPAISEHTLLHMNNSAEAGKRIHGLSGTPSRVGLTPLRVVGDRYGHLNLVPVEEAAAVMVRLSLAAPAALSTCNVVHHHEVAVPLMLQLLQQLSPLPLRLVDEPPAEPNIYERSAARGPAQAVAPYLLHRRTFDDTHTRRLIGPPGGETVVDLDYLLAGMGYASRHGQAADLDTSATPIVVHATTPQPHPVQSVPADAGHLSSTGSCVRGLAFIVTAGRSGSTAMSTILRSHPEVLSLNEFFMSVRTSALPQTVVTAERFRRMLTDPHPLFDRMIRGGAGTPELIYPLLSGTRFDAHTTGIPAIALTSLPHLSDTPDATFDELVAEVAGWPEQSIAQHFRALFGWMAEQFGGTVAIERSGMSLGWTAWLHDSFPEARFIHLYRSGPDSALSMSRHSGFRMMALVQDALELFGSDDAPHQRHWQFDPAAIPDEAVEFLGDRIDGARLAALNLPLTRFGRMWSELIATGSNALAGVPTDRQLAISFEHLVTDPKTELTRLTEFLDIAPDIEWISAGAAALDPGRIGAAAALSADEHRALVEACRPGTQLLSAYQ